MLNDSIYIILKSLYAQIIPDMSVYWFKQIKKSFEGLLTKITGMIYFTKIKRSDKTDHWRGGKYLGSF